MMKLEVHWSVLVAVAVVVGIVLWMNQGQPLLPTMGKSSAKSKAALDEEFFASMGVEADE